MTVNQNNFSYIGWHYFKNIVFAVAIQDKESKDILKDIKNIYQEYAWENLIYHDTSGTWNGWNSEIGFIFLGVKQDILNDYIMNLFIFKLRLKEKNDLRSNLKYPRHVWK